MKEKLFRSVFTALLITFVWGACRSERAVAASYTYDFWANDYKSLPAFCLERTIDSQSMGVNISAIDDVSYGNGMLFFVDSKESRLNIVDMDFRPVASVKLIRNAEGKIALKESGDQEQFNAPEGVCYNALTNEILVADTGAERIVILDGDGFYLKRIIERPANMVGVTQFFPSKIFRYLKGYS